MGSEGRGRGEGSGVMGNCKHGKNAVKSAAKALAGGEVW